MGDDPALLARRFWALPSCSPARRVRPASGLLPHRSHGGRLPLLSPGQVSSVPKGGVLLSLRAEFSCPGGRCSIQSGSQGCPCLPARMKTHLPQSRRVLSPDLRSPSPSAGPWGNALLRRALRRSRTRPRRSPGRASSQLHALARQAAFRRPPGTAERYSTGAGAASPPRHRPLRKRPLLGEE